MRYGGRVGRARSSSRASARTGLRVWLLLILLPSWPACGARTGLLVDEWERASNRDGGPPPADVGPPDAPLACSPSPPIGAHPGAACHRDGTCDGHECNDTFRHEFPTRTGGAIPATFHPGSSCGDTCDAESGDDPCGECGTCSRYARVGQLLIPALGRAPSGLVVLLEGLCRSDCVPDVASNGGCRPGYTCDVDERVCLEGCAIGNVCNYERVDDHIMLTPEGPWTCNPTTLRCTLRGTPGAAAGDPCVVDTDCMDDGTCWTGEWLPAGYCTRVGCDAEGFECGPGETCALRPLGGASWCARACVVGAEVEADRLGPGGHGAGCPAQQSCIWDGRGSEPDGACTAGNYNEVRAPNVGAACQDGRECYSPFGLGRCIGDRDLRLGSGMCAIADCVPGDANGVLPGVSTTTRVCDEDAGERCVRTSDDETHCLRACSRASECPAGYACALVTGSERLCWPRCFTHADCREGAMCEGVEGEPCDPALGLHCLCSDRAPRGS